MIKTITSPSSLHSSYEIIHPSPSWKEALLVSAVALAALASFVQVSVGSLSVAIVYGFLGTAAYIGYEAQKNITYSHRKEEYYTALHRHTETLRQECSSFRVENKAMAQSNENLTVQVNLLKGKLKEMENLLAKIDSSATLTKDLLTSCMDVSKDQKKTEKRIEDLLTSLEKKSHLHVQKDIEKHVKQLENTLLSMEKQIKQFFLHDAKASKLLEIKQEFAQTSKDLEVVKIELERVQKELSETSARLEKNSQEIDSKISKLSDQEVRLGQLKKLTSLTISLLKKPEVHQKLSLKERQQLDSLEKTWQSITF